MNRVSAVLCVVVGGLVVSGVDAQGLYQRRQGVPLNDLGEPDPSVPLRGVSMLVTSPPPPPSFERYDLITIIVNESSSHTREQTVETERDATMDTSITSIPSIQRLLRDQTIENGLEEQLELFGYDAQAEFEGDGQYDRTDRVQNRITAQIIDVKPNGNLVLEARTRIQTDDEIQNFVLSGVCRTADITANNTVQSSQLFDLRIDTQNEGELRQSTRKGWLTRFLERVSPF